MGGFSQSRFAAKLQEAVSKRRYEAGLYGEIAEKLLLPESGAVLDVGTGTGLQLKAIYELNQSVALYGLDLSAETIKFAEAYLAGLPVELSVGSIEHTNYPENTFDIVTCNSSMSYWKNPVSCYNEIYRILKPGGYTKLFEPQKDFDMDEVISLIKENMADKSSVRRFLAVQLNRFGLKWGYKVGLNLYSIEELGNLSSLSFFHNNFIIEKVTLQNLPIFACITLSKPLTVD
jgi:ubiquinone/menaquinone biosynthesis C-methylase UbiE